MSNIDSETLRFVEYVATLPEEKIKFVLRWLWRLEQDGDDSFLKQSEKDSTILRALWLAGNTRALDRWLRRNTIRAVK